MVCFEQFVLPLLRRRMGHPALFRRTVVATLAHAVKHRPGREEFIRVTLTTEHDGRLLATSRITSYNVCYTKLLREIVALVGEQLVGGI